MSDDASSFIVEILLKAVDQASGPIRNLGRAVDELKTKAAAEDATGDLSHDMEDLGRSAREAEGDVRSHRDELGRSGEAARRHRKEVSRGADAIDDHADSAAKARQPVRALGQDTDKATDAAKRHADAVARVSEEYKGWAAASRESTLTNAENARGLQQISREAEQLTRVLPRASQSWRDMASIASEAGREAKRSGVADETERLTRSYREFDQMARAGQVTASAAKDSYRDFATSFDRMRDSMDKGSESWRVLGRVIDDATKKAAHARTVVTGGGMFSGFLGGISSAAQGGGLKDLDRSLQNLSAHADSFGIKIVSLSAQLRGLALTAVFGLFQQLDTAIVGVVGSLFSLSSAAVQAGAALGGTFIAAVAQAVPAISIFVDALNRLKLVMQAVQAAQNLQQQTATNAVNQRINELSGTNAVISAQENLANSYVQVRNAQDQLTVSQQNLTIARRDAARQIVDLMYAEEQAELQEKGANITLQQAQQQLQQTIISGGTGTQLASAQLQVQQARLGVRQARTAVPRARFDYNLARRQGVEGAPSVVAARESVQQAAESLTQANQAIGNAGRALELAKLQASQATSSIAQAANALKYLLGEMTPAERKVYEVLEKIASYFRDPNSPFNKIGDYIVAPFAGGLQRVLSLLNNKDFLAPFDRLGKQLGAGLRSIFGQLTGKQGANFIDQMATDASQNIPTIVNSFSKLITIFEKIATAAAPALHVFVVGFNRFLGSITKRWSTPEGFDKLVDFFNKGAQYAKELWHWLGAVVHLLEALGHQAAPVGGNLLQGWTDSLNKMSEWVRSHGTDVHSFFVQAGNALNTLAKIVGVFASAMIELLNSGALSSFGELLQRVIVPVLADAFRVLGAFTNAIISLLNNIPALRQFLDLFGGFAVAAIAIGKLYAPLRRFITLLLALKEGGAAFMAMRSAGGGLVDSLNAAKTAVADRLATERQIITAINEQTAALQEQLGVMREVEAGAATEDAEIVGGGAAAGPVSAGGLTAEETGGGGALAGVAAGGASDAILPLGAAMLAGYGLDKLSHAIFGNGKFTSVQQLQQAPGFVQSAVDPKITSKLLQSTANIDVTQLPNSQLSMLYETAHKFLNLPDITATQRRGLEALVEKLNPANVQLQKMYATWQSTFSGISTTTGNVLKQVQQTVAQDIQNISTNLGTGTKQGAEALDATFSSAITSILDNTTKAARGTKSGMAEINKTLNEALRAMNEPAIDFFGVGKSPGVGGASLSTLVANARAAPRRAEGGWNRAVPGGMVYRAGEAGHDEVTLTTDPKYAARQGDLLGEYLQRAPHMATGGFVADPGTNFSYGEEPQISKALEKLAEYLGITIYGLSGYRSPAHSVAVGGFSDDPHTKGEAADIGVNSQLRASASRLSNAILSKFGLWRPFDMSGQDPAELNHVQLLPAFGGPTVGGTTPPATSAKASAILGGSATGAAATAISAITAPTIKAAGAAAILGQAVLNKTTDVANKFLAATTGSLTAAAGGTGSVSTSGIAPGSWMQVAKQLAAKFGWGTSQVQDWEGVERLEDGSFSLSATNPTSGAYGLAQGISGPSWYYGYGGNPNSLIGQLTAMANYMKQRYGDPAGALAHEQAYHWYDGGGRIGYNAPWGGRPVPIVAHEGERISNPNQWEHIAGLGGMTGSQLDNHMGYGSGAPKQSFDSGGAPTVVSSSLQPQSGHSMNGGWPSLTNVPWGSLSSISVIIQYVNKAFEKLSSISSQSAAFSKSFIGFVNALMTQDTGIFDRLNTGFTVIQNALNAAVVLGGRVAGVGMSSAQRGYLRGFRAPFRTGRGGYVHQTASVPTQDQESVRALEEQQTYLTGERTVLERTLAPVAARLARVRALAKQDPSKYNAALQSLTTAYNGLVNRIQGVTTTLAQGVTNIFNTETQKVQDLLTLVGDKYDTQQQQIQARQSIAEQGGNYQLASTFDTRLAVSATSELKALQPVLKAAQKSGDTDLVAQIKQEMSQLRETAGEAAISALTDAQEAISQTAQTQQARISMYQSISQTMEGSAATTGQFAAAGAVNQQALSMNQSSLRSQLSQYNTLLGAAVASGNQGLISSITQTIDQLTGELASNTQALEDNTATVVNETASFIQSRGQFQTGVYGGLSQILTTIGQTTGFTDIPALMSVTSASNTSLQGTNAGLIRQLAALGSGGAVIANMLQGITDPGQMATLLGGINLSSAESGQDSTWISTFETIISNLAQNTEAIATNNQQLATLNGQLLQPQSWSTSAWTAFRTAIFSGMGSLLPSYSAVLPSSALPTEAPVFGASGAGSSGQAPTIGELTVNHAPTPGFNSSVLGEQLAFEAANALG